MTLDAVLDPVEWATGEKPGVGLTQPYTYRLDSFDGAQRALETFFQECASAGPDLAPCGRHVRWQGRDGGRL